MQLKHAISKREKTFLAITIVVILSVLCYNFVISVYVNNLKDFQNLVAAKEISLKKAKKLLGQKDGILAEYGKYAESLKIQGESEEEAVAILLSRVESLTRKSNVFVSDVKPRPIKDFGLFKRFNFDIEVDGELDNITKFIYEIENSSSAVRIERLQINVKSGKTSSLRAEISVSKLVIP